MGDHQVETCLIISSIKIKHFLLLEYIVFKEDIFQEEETSFFIVL